MPGAHLREESDNCVGKERGESKKGPLYAVTASPVMKTRSVRFPQAKPFLNLL